MSQAELAALAAVVPGSPEAWADYPGDETATHALRSLLGVTISFMILNTLFVGLRFIASIFLRGKTYRLGLDDWLLIPAWIFTTALSACVLIIYHQETIGNGPAHRPIFDYRLTPILKSTYSGVQFLLPSYLFTRVSILVLYLRIFTGKWVRRISYFMIGFVCVQYVAFMITSLLQCLPIPYFWDKMRPGGGHCISINGFYRSFTPPNMFVDLVLIFTPLPTVWRLQASQRRKWGYTIVFFTGFIALIASIVRQYELTVQTSEQLYPHVSNIIISWLVLEPSLYLITACMPGMVPLLAICLPPAARQTALSRRNTTTYHPNGFHHPSTSFHSRTLSNRRARHDSAASGPSQYGDTGFMPLVDEPHTTSGRAETVKGGGGAGTGVRHARDGSGGEGIPMDDLRKVNDGGGIMVTTEVSVTQEERFVEILGF